MIPARETVDHHIYHEKAKAVNRKFAGCWHSNTENFIYLHSQRYENVSRC